MVNALSRDLTRLTMLCETRNDSALLKVKDEKLPCALREFVNSNIDLPTIDELIEKSPALATAFGANQRNK
jgi:hypothetical protein